MRGSLDVVIWPQVILQVLAEFQHHDPSNCKLGTANLLKIDLVDNAGIECLMLATCLGRPVLARHLR